MCDDTDPDPVPVLSFIWNLLEWKVTSGTSVTLEEIVGGPMTEGRDIEFYYDVDKETI